MRCYFFANSLQHNRFAQVLWANPIAGAGTDFGNGQSDFGPSISSTTYRYVGKTPEDSEYTLAKTIKGLNKGWLQDIKNHTPNDPDGYMMVVNASHDKDIFYSATVSSLCAGTTYEFGAYIINLLNNNNGVEPNVTFSIYDGVSKILLASNSTGNIHAGSATDWKQYGLIFTTPSNNSSVIIEMSSVDNPTRGGGNDLALDDITFRACGPTITTKNNNQAPTPIDMCIGESQIINLTAELSDGYFSPAYQWQVSNGSGYLDIPGQNTNAFSVNTNTLPAGNYKFRVRVAEAGKYIFVKVWYCRSTYFSEYLPQTDCKGITDQHCLCWARN